MSERMIDPEFLKKLRNRWQADRRKGNRSYEEWQKELKDLFKSRAHILEQKLSLIDKIKWAVIKFLLPKEEVMSLLLKSERLRQDKMVDKYTEELQQAWNSFVSAKVERDRQQQEEDLRLHKKGVKLPLHSKVMLLALPVEDREADDERL